MAVTHFPERHYEGMLFEAFLDLSNKHGPKKGWLRLWYRSIGRDPIWSTLGPQIVQFISCRSLIKGHIFEEERQPIRGLN